MIKKVCALTLTGFMLALLFPFEALCPPPPVAPAPGPPHKPIPAPRPAPKPRPIDPAPHPRHPDPDPRPDPGPPPPPDCFIATAAYGVPWSRQVTILRTFRDNWLMTNSPGRWIVKNYYKYSPPLANKIQQRPAAKLATRMALEPIVKLARAANGENLDLAPYVCIAGVIF